MKGKLIIFLLAYSPIFSWAQLPNILKDKVKDINKVVEKAIDNEDVIKVKDEVLKEAKDRAEGKLKKKFDNFKEDYDEADFNYAIAFSDNTGLFETKEKAKKHKVLLLEGIEKTKDIKNIKDAELDDIDVKATDLNIAGEMLFAAGKYRAAELSFRKAMNLYHKNDKLNTKEGAIPVSNLALLYQTVGRYTKSDSLTDVVLNARGKISKSNIDYAVSLNNKAVLYKDLGRYNESEKLINEALEVAKKREGDKSLPYALMLNNKAMLFQAVGRKKEAKTIIENALVVAKETLKEKSSNYVKLTINQAHLLQDLGEYEEAEKVYLNAIKIKERRLGKSHPDYAHLKRGLATLYMEMNRPEEVEVNLKEAKEIYAKKLGEDHPAYASVVSDLGNFYRVNTKSDQALSNLLLAYSIRDKALGSKHPSTIDTREDLALVYWQLGKFQEAHDHYVYVINTTLDYVDTYFSPMSEREKGKFLAELTPRFQRFASFSVAAAGNYSDLMQLLFESRLQTKALLLNSSSKVRNLILSSNDQKLIRKYNKWIDVKEDLARLYTLSKEELEEEEVDIAALEEKANQLEKELSEESTDFRSSHKKEDVSISRIQSTLTDEDVVVEVIQFEEFENNFTGNIHYLVMTVNKMSGDTPLWHLFTDGTQMEGEELIAYRKNIKALRNDPRAYNTYWAPFEKLLSDKRKIYFSPDGVYNQVNLNTLYGNDGKYLIDKYRIILLGNAKEVIKDRDHVKRRTERLKTASLYGYPNYGEGGTIMALPGTKAEVENISKILRKEGFKVSNYLGNEASERNIKETSSEVLHIATHGFFLPAIENPNQEKVLGIETSQAIENPLHRSGLLLAGAEQVFSGKSIRNSNDNGVLTAYEAMNLSLENTQLVVLSACETGLGDVKVGEGVYGLQRSFMVAGADAVIMSLWTVADQTTADLMTFFYENYSKTGNKHNSFYVAQLQLKKKYPQANYWGAFVLMGD